jgi:hypothetical protein
LPWKHLPAVLVHHHHLTRQLLIRRAFPVIFRWRRLVFVVSIGFPRGPGQAVRLATSGAPRTPRVAEPREPSIEEIGYPVKVI